MDHLKSLEIELHQYETRLDSDKLTRLLHPGFVEIGYSGKTYDFKSALNSLSVSPVNFLVWSQDYEYIEYALNIIQVIYLSANIDEHGYLHRYAKRTSIWVDDSGNWQMKFHQATPIPAFEKSNG